MGISRFVSAAAGVPMFFFSGNVAGKFSVDEILIASLLAYVVRFGIYASMRRALGWGLLAEALRGVTFGGERAERSGVERSGVEEDEHTSNH